MKNGTLRIRTLLLVAIVAIATVAAAVVSRRPADLPPPAPSVQELPATPSTVPSPPTATPPPSSTGAPLLPILSPTAPPRPFILPSPTSTPLPQLPESHALAEGWPADLEPLIDYVGPDGYRYWGTVDGAYRRLLIAESRCPTLTWSPDGQRLLCHSPSQAGAGAQPLLLLDVEGGLVLQDPEVLIAAWSRDGEFLAYAKRTTPPPFPYDRSVEAVTYCVVDRNGIELAQLPGVLLPYGVFAANAGSMQWSPDGGTLAFLSSPSTVTLYNTLRNAVRDLEGDWEAVLGWTHGGDRLLVARDLAWQMFADYRAYSVGKAFGDADRVLEFDNAQSLWHSPDGRTAVTRQGRGIDQPLVVLDWGSGTRAVLADATPCGVGKGSLELEGVWFSRAGDRLYWQNYCTTTGTEVRASDLDGTDAVTFKNRDNLWVERPVVAEGEQHVLVRTGKMESEAVIIVVDPQTGRVLPLPAGVRPKSFRPTAR